MLPAIATAIILSAAWLAWEVWTAPVLPERRRVPSLLLDREEASRVELARRALAAEDVGTDFHDGENARG